VATGIGKPKSTRINKLAECYTWNIALYPADIWTLLKVYAESFKISCWSRMEEIIWALRMKTRRSIAWSQGGKVHRNRIKRWKANWTGHILRRFCLLKHIVEGKIEGRVAVKRRRGKRRQLILDDLNERIIEIERGVHNGAVGRGTELQAGKSWVRFPVGSLVVFIDLIFRTHYGPRVDSAFNRNEY
jgi:ribosomal protein L35